MGLLDFSPGLMSATAASLAFVYLYLYKLKPKKPLLTSYDYIVIGGGSAGCVVAARLSEDPTKSVLLLEAGPEADDYRIGIPAASPTLQQSDVDWNYQIKSQEHACHGLKDNSIKWPRGKVLGGCSSVNAMIYIRGHRADYDSWQKLGADGWGWDDVLPYFLKSENNIIPDQVSSQYHNAGGPLTVSERPFTCDMSLQFVTAGEQLGYNKVDFNTGDNIGFGTTATTINEKTQRCHTSRAYLDPARHRANLTIVPNAHVTKIVVENRKAVGVRFLMGAEEKYVTVLREVVLSAGAIGSPQILMLSGIGPKSHLDDVGIDCIHDLPVGDNLQDHLGIQVRANVNKESGVITIGQMGSLVTMAKYLLGSKSMLATNGVEACGFYKTQVEDNIEWPDMQVHFVSTFYITGDDEEQFIPLSNKKFYPFFGHDVPKRQRLSREGVTFIPTLLHPRSSGTIRLNSSDPLDPPIIDPRYFEDDHDVKVMVEGVRMCKKLAETDAMKSKGTQLVNLQMPEEPEEDEFSDNNLSAFCRHFCGTIYHPVGTCKMGAAGDPTAVVDPQLRVRGIDGLRVIDASVMPHLPSGNTNAPTIMIGEKGADLLKEKVY